MFCPKSAWFVTLCWLTISPVGHSDVPGAPWPGEWQLGPPGQQLVRIIQKIKSASQKTLDSTGFNANICVSADTKKPRAVSWKSTCSLIFFIIQTSGIYDHSFLHLPTFQVLFPKTSWNTIFVFGQQSVQTTDLSTPTSSGFLPTLIKNKKKRGYMAFVPSQL